MLRVPPMIIGLTIVAMGTSLPECAVSVTAAVSGSNTLAISNVVGSNIFNLMMVCGVCALFNRLPVHAETLQKEFPLSIICAGLLLLFGYTRMVIGQIEGVILLVVFVGYIIWMIFTAMKARRSSVTDFEVEDYEIMPVWKCVIFIVGGMAAIKFGGDFVVDGAVDIAKAFGISDTLIGLTIVAFGTSLPELATSCSCSAQERSRYRGGQCHRIEYIQYTVRAGRCRRHKPDELYLQQSRRYRGADRDKHGSALHGMEKETALEI